jgi:hypothetical protein
MASSAARRLRTLLIVVVVLVALFVVVDRVSVYFAEKQAAKALQNSQQLPNRPDVGVSGFPFLTQLARGTFDTITADATDVPLGTALDASSLHIALHHVDESNTFKTFHVRTATASARLDYAALSRPIGATVAYAGSGRVKVTKSVTVLGHTFSGTITAEPRLVNNTLGFTKTAVNGLGSVAAAVTSALTKVFDVTLPLSRIPFQVRAISLDAAANGITLSLSGANLVYTRS